MARRLECVDRICPAFFIARETGVKFRRQFKLFMSAAGRRKGEVKENERKTNFKNAGDSARVYDGIHIDTGYCAG